MKSCNENRFPCERGNLSYMGSRPGENQPVPPADCHGRAKIFTPVESHHVLAMTGTPEHFPLYFHALKARASVRINANLKTGVTAVIGTIR